MEQNRPWAQPMKTMKRTTEAQQEALDTFLLKGERQKDPLKRMHGQERPSERLP